MRNPGLLALASMLAATATLTGQSTKPDSQPRVILQAPPPQYAPAGFPQSGHGPVRISGGVMAGQLTSRVDPEYPADARAQGVEGSVVLHVLVGKDGAVESVIPVSGPEVLRQPAVDAVKQWTYKPFLLNGDPVEVDTTVTVNFNLNRSQPQP